MRNFDRFIGIDWSGALSPVHTRAISVAQCTQASPVQPVQPPHKNKYWSRAAVGDFIKNLASRSNNRTLIGIDANFGYAGEIVQEQFGADANHLDIWSAVENASLGAPNYFAGGYWQSCPNYFWTEGKMSSAMRFPKRHTELACGNAGFGWPESPFKLIGAKQVGKGGLAAMRLALNLKRACGDLVCIWPFEHQIADKARVVITEIYPRQFLMRCGHGLTKIRNARDLETALTYFGASAEIIHNFSDHDADAIVSAAGLRWLCGKGETIPDDLAYPALALAARGKCSTAEGWIFGVEWEPQ
jgi:hypothetical protein